MFQQEFRKHEEVLEKDEEVLEKDEEVFLFREDEFMALTIKYLLSFYIENFK